MTIPENILNLNDVINLFNSIPAGIGFLRIVNGVKDESTVFNEYFFNHIDVSQSATNTFVTKDFMKCVYKDDVERVINDLNNGLKLKGPLTGEYRLLSKVDNTYHWFYVQCKVV